MPLWKTGNALGGEPGSLYHGDECCCGYCCHFIHCDPSAETIDLYLDCTDIIAELVEGDIIEIDGECFEYQGEVECVGDEDTGDYGDIYETCDDCLCLCAIYTECENPATEIRFKRCRPFTVIIGPGDVIKHEGTCYEYDHLVDCQGGEDDIGNPTKYEDCDNCRCKCATFENCDNALDVIELKFCEEPGLSLEVGDVIYHDGKCYELTEFITCTGDETEVTDPEEQVDCTTCRGECCCVGPLTECSGGISFNSPYTCGGGFSQPVNGGSASWSWSGTAPNCEFEAAVGWGHGSVSLTASGVESCSGPFSGSTGVNFAGRFDFSGATITAAKTGDGYTLTVSGVTTFPGFGDCPVDQFNDSWFVPANGL